MPSADTVYLGLLQTGPAMYPRDALLTRVVAINHTS